MARWQKVSFLMLLCFLIHIQGQDDFDLADALDDTEEITRKPNPITRKPGSGIYPKPNPPNRPQPGIYDNPGGNINDLDLDDGRYPPKPRPPAGGGGYSNYGNTQGDSVARIVSPIVSVVVVSLIGAATSYFAYNRRRNCCRTNDFNRGKWEIRRLCSGSKKQCHK
ncbi:glycoprotein Xg isoform X6 [Sarcophilus harrisii]|uniref:glycoprotein Xg isoform X6 n=1 Tax=Sarcophilus harrisii TaxID=9305 RepID=UPI001301F346|nr:glycoprotein Xg isoform X6 [Sarcophilus harrisii]